MSDTRLIIPALGPLYRSLSWVPLTLVRVMSGVSLAAHGYPKLFGNTAAQARFFASAGFEPAMFWTILTGCVEFFGGLCLAIGLATRLVSIPILIFLATAVTYHWQFGFYWNNKGFEFPLFWCLVILHFLVNGGGHCSVDAKLGREI